MTETTLDRAFQEMDPEDDAARVRFLGRVAAAEVFLLLKSEARGEMVEAQVFAIDPDPIALVFDTEARLAAFSGGPAPYAALSGRAVADLLAGQGIGLGLNLGTGISDFVLPPDGVTWLADASANQVEADQARLKALDTPRGVPESVIAEVDARLAGFEGQASRAYLAMAEFDSGGTGHVLVVLNAEADARDAISKAVNEALVFSGVDAATLNVIFADDGDAVVPRLEAVALRIDLPEPVAPSLPMPPGGDPKVPPKLR